MIENHGKGIHDLEINTLSVFSDILKPSYLQLDNILIEFDVI